MLLFGVCLTSTIFPTLPPHCQACLFVNNAVPRAELHNPSFPADRRKGAAASLLGYTYTYIRQASKQPCFGIPLPFARAERGHFPHSHTFSSKVVCFLFFAYSNTISTNKQPSSATPGPPTPTSSSRRGMGGNRSFGV